MPVDHGELDVLKIKYSAAYPPLPAHLTGENFSHIFGTNTSILELFILKRKLRGPQWVQIQNFQEVKEYKKTWCKFELVINDPKDLFSTADDLNREAPPLTVMSFSHKTTKN